MVTTRHTQRWVTTPDGVRVEVDEGIADLLIQLWRWGIATNYSCQNGTDCGDAYIQFAGAPSARRFVHLALACSVDGVRDVSCYFSPRLRSLGPPKQVGDLGIWHACATCLPFAETYEDLSQDRVSIDFPAGVIESLARTLATMPAPALPKLTAHDRALLDGLEADWNQHLAADREALAAQHQTRGLPSWDEMFADFTVRVAAARRSSVSA